MIDVNLQDAAVLTLAAICAVREWRISRSTDTAETRARQLAAKPVQIDVRCGDELVRYIRADAAKQVVHQMMLELAARTAREARARLVHFARSNARGFTLDPSSANSSTVKAPDTQP